MSRMLRIFVVVLCLVYPVIIFAQDITVAGASEAADGLDLKAVGELFREADNPEAFERALNDTKTGINNLDLDDDGNVDYIRVVDTVDADTHVLVMQVQLSETEYQDVATIEIEKRAGDYEVQIRGNEQIYGVNYYVRPAGVVWASVGLVSWIYRPYYRPYVSVYRFGYYPRWWRPWRPVTVSVYRTRTVRYSRRVTWTVSKRSTVVSARRVYVAPRSSVLVRKSLRQPTTAQKSFQARSRTKTVSGGGFGKTTRASKVTGPGGGEATRKKTTVTGPGGGEATHKKTTVTGPGGAEIDRKKTTVTGPGGGEATRKKTTVTGPGGREVSRTKTKVEGAEGAGASRKRTTVKGKDGAKVTRNKAKVKSRDGKVTTRKQTKAKDGQGNSKSKTKTRKRKKKN